MAPPARPFVPAAWNDTPLRVKLGLLVALALVCGAGMGLLEARFGHRLWPLALGLSMVMVVVCTVAHQWAWRPLEELIERLNRMSHHREPGDLQTLPTNRCDEIGHLARGVHELVKLHIRDHHEARQLRATLDHRIAQATQQATAELRKIAMRDALTGLGNRRFLDEQFEPLIRSVREARRDLACIVVDMDHFKKVNDTLGHSTGDGLLVMAAQILRATCRREDFVIRLGGDEFVVLMPDCPPDRAVEYFNRVRTMFRNQARVALPASLQPDLSAGMAWLERDAAADGAELLHKADEKLYDAKRNGRGRAVAG